MREILFRGQDSRSKKWIYGYYNGRENSFARIIDTDNFTRLVNPETVGQYTGTTDKNGTKIFEGDIIQDSNYPEYVFRIEYHNGTIIASEIHTFDKVYLDNFICFNIFEAFVIGNVHDNPELLRGKA